MQEICVLQRDDAVIGNSMHLQPWLGMFLSLMICSCGVANKNAKTEEKPFGPTGVPPQLRANPEVDRGLGEEGVNAQQISVAMASHPSAENILWIDSDDVDQTLPELRKLLAAPKREVWMKSENQAKRAAIREGKCVLIWFTDSARSPLCKHLSAELFGRAEFGEWAKENTVRLMIDQSALMARGEKYDNDVSAQAYVEQMKKKYKAMGAPVVIMLSPKGEMLGKYRGYTKGQGEFLWGQLKHSSRVGKIEYDSWLKKLEKQGYRRWYSRTGQTLVARLVAYRNGQMIMVEPDGNRFRTNENFMSIEDQEWLAAEKKKRGIQ